MNAPGVSSIWQAADVLQPLQAWLRLICVFSSLRLARENHSIHRANFEHRSKIWAIFALNGFVSHERQKCQCDSKEKPPLPSLKWAGYSHGWLQVQASKEQAGFHTRSCEQTPAKKQHYANSRFGMWIHAADFLPSHTQTLQLFRLCAVIQSDSQAEQEQAISILGWEASLKEGSSTNNLTQCTALLFPGPDTKPMPWLPVVIKYPEADVIRTNDTNSILWPNLDMNISSLGSPGSFIWKEFLCLKLSHFQFSTVKHWLHLMPEGTVSQADSVISVYISF